MIFWDSSAIVPLILSEKETDRCLQLIEDDSEMAVWMYTATEVLSAVYRKYREGEIDERELPSIQERLSKLRAAWSEVLPREPVRTKAHRLLAVHPLRAADALQLAAALIVFHESPEGERFITFDKALSRIARLEGFDVL